MRGNFGALFMTFPSLFTSESQFDKIHPVFLLVLKYSERGGHDVFLKISKEKTM